MVKKLSHFSLKDIKSKCKNDMSSLFLPKLQARTWVIPISLHPTPSPKKKNYA